MKNMNTRRILSAALCMVLIAAMALSFAACGQKEAPNTEGTTIHYTVITVDLEGAETTYDITTNRKTVGEELIAQGIIEGEQGDYGMYIKTVGGLTLDWDKDAKYWAFYIGDEYATTGVDMTDAEDGATYILKPEG